MKLTVSKKDNIIVTVYCWEREDAIEASHEQSEVPKDATAETFDFIFRKPGYGDTNTIIKSAGAKVVEGEDVKLDISIFQDQILRTLLTSWTLKGDDKDLPCNSTNISNLVPTVARAAVTGAMEKLRF